MSVDTEVTIEISRDLYAELLGVTMALSQILSDMSESRLFSETVDGVAALTVKQIEERLRDAGKLATMQRATCQ
jgi:hypothetical protein